MVPAQACAGISDDVCGRRQLASMTISMPLLVNDDSLGNKRFYVFETAGRLFRLFKLKATAAFMKVANEIEYWVPRIHVVI
jgi:hypothetical protein